MNLPDLYAVLGLKRTARKADIERVGRRLERLHHPSLHPGDRPVQERFEEIRVAFEVLRDPARRKLYDRTGKFEGEGVAEGAPAPAPTSPPERSEIYVTVSVSFEEAASGCERELPFEGERDCPACRGRGCAGCHGRGRVRAPMSAVVSIPAGVDAGTTLRFPRPDGPGELVVVTAVGAHPFFRRVGNNLYCEIPVSVPEAALGARVEVPTLTGAASVKIPPGTQSGQKLRLRERGLPSLAGSGRGDLYVEIRVVTPDTRDERIRGLLRELARALAARGDDPRAGMAGGKP